MHSIGRQHIVHGHWTMAALALALLSWGGRAHARAPIPVADALERASALVRARAFDQAAVILRDVVSVDPANRAAREMLAFTLESVGDLDAERGVRSELATAFPDDARIQADYGRVLERSGEERGALSAYRHARDLSAGPAPELDAAIERVRGRTAMEIGVPLAVTSDPDATASCAQAGAAVPFGSRHHLTLLVKRHVADGRRGPESTESDLVGLSWVMQHDGSASWTLGPRVHGVRARGASRRNVSAGGVIAGRTPLGPSFEAEARADVETPWDEAAVTVLRGGRNTAAEGHLYSHWLSRRVILGAGARARRLSVLPADPRSARRPEATQSLWLAGADLVLWRKPGAAVRGEMLDEALVAPAGLSPAMTLAYRHYDVTTRATPEFQALVGVAPRASLDEASVDAIVASPRGHLALELRAGLARDTARGAHLWRAGGALIWAPTPATRFALGLERATESASGLVGQRRDGRLSVHVDL